MVIENTDIEARLTLSDLGRTARRFLDKLASNREMRAVATGVAMAGMLAMASFSANAQAVTKFDPPVTLQTDCHQYANDQLKSGKVEIGVDALCAYEQARLAQEEFRRAKQQGSVEAQLKQCIAALTDFKKNNPDGFSRLGTVTRENACGLAARVPRPTSAPSS